MEGILYMLLITVGACSIDNAHRSCVYVCVSVASKHCDAM